MSSDTWSLANRIPVCPTKIKFPLAWRYRTHRAQDPSLSWFVRLAVDVWFESLSTDTTNAGVLSLHDLRGIQTHDHSVRQVEDSTRLRLHNYRSRLCSIVAAVSWVLGAFVKVRKVTIRLVMSDRPSIRPHGTTPSHRTNFHEI
jgi:hypothetical protein